MCASSAGGWLKAVYLGVRHHSRVEEGCPHVAVESRAHDNIEHHKESERDAEVRVFLHHGNQKPVAGDVPRRQVPH